MAVTSFQDLPLADRDRAWDGDAAEKRVREWAGAQDEPSEKYRDAHVWYDADKKENFTAYKLLICDVVDEKLVALLAAEPACERSRATSAASGSPANHADSANSLRFSGCRSLLDSNEPEC